MCGIIGYTGKKDATPLLVEGLKRLEYRGYDSAGVALSSGGKLSRARAQGKIVALDKQLMASPLSGSTGVGHTRWATHGVPSEVNAHPHMTDKVAVVHNGIIENYRDLRDEMTKAGHAFTSQTDTEAVPVMITHYLSEGLTPKDAVAKTLARIEGAFALGIVFADHPDLIMVARRGSPLAIGYGKEEMYIGSDAVALAPFTSRISYLEEGDWAAITPEGAMVYDEAGEKVERKIHISAQSGAAVEKGDHRHFMHKEIHEQPGVLGETLSVFYNPEAGAISLPEFPFDLKKIERITLVACGTSYYAGMVAKYWIEQIARVPVELDIASEFRYREPVFSKEGLAIFISQSGETADTLAALKLAKQHKQHTLAIVNVRESTMAHEAEAVLNTYAGPEIGVASTKAFTTQLMTLACFTIALASTRGALSKEKVAALSYALAEVPARVAEILHHENRIAEVATQLVHATDMLYMGRGMSYPIALEGALKLKEISYIHAEGYAAGEMKHGPIALIDEDTPVVVIAPSDAWFDKTASNIHEAKARGAKVILISDKKGIHALREDAAESIMLPESHPLVAPILYAIPVQLLAYHVAVLKGTDVDQPRNLAKSVTVE